MNPESMARSPDNPREAINPERRLMKEHGLHGKQKKRARRVVRERARARNASANFASEKGEFQP